MVAAIVAIFGLLGAASAGAAPLALTSNFEVGTVSVIDTQTNETVGEPITVGGRPKSIAITPDARFAYVVNEEFDGVSVIDLAARRVVGAPIEVGDILGQIAISPDGETAYVTDYSSERLLVIETLRNRVIAEVVLGAHPNGIAIAPDGTTAYVSEEEAQAVEVVDTQTKKVIGNPIHLSDSPEGIAVSPDGKTVYVGDGLAGLAAINTATRQVSYISTASWAGPVSVTPDGQTAWVSDSLGNSVSAIDLRTGALIKEVQVGSNPGETAITPDGKFTYVPDLISGDIRVIDTQTFKEARPPIPRSGLGASDLAITPDQSPTAIFSPPAVTAGVPANFDGTASTDPDGSVAAWSWSFGDGATASGSIVDHTYAGPGTYNAALSVTDDEGCGEAEVFTGRTAYCSGNPLAKVVHPVEAKAPVTSPVCTNRLRFGAVVHNRRNGTVRVQVKLRAAGALFLFGKKIHAVTRKSVKAGSTFLTLHARVRVNKRLKKIHHTRVRYRLTFYPAAGCSPTTRHRSVALLRAPRKKKHHHR